jgi:hypothetical protein
MADVRTDSERSTVPDATVHAVACATAHGEAEVVGAVTPPPLPALPARRNAALPPPLPGAAARGRRILSEVLTLPPLPVVPGRSLWSVVAPARTLAAAAHLAAPVVVPAKRVSNALLAACAAAGVLSVGGAFAAGLWLGRGVPAPEAPPSVPVAAVSGARAGAPVLASSEAPAAAPGSLLLVAPGVGPKAAAAGDALSPSAPMAAWEPSGPARPSGIELAAEATADELAASSGPELFRTDRPAKRAVSTQEAFLSLFGQDPRATAPVIPGAEGLQGTAAIAGRAPNGNTVYVPPDVGQELPEVLDREDVLQVVLAHKDELVECVREQQQREPDLHGTLTVRWTILPNGASTAVAVESEQLRGTALAGCARQRIGKWTFPAHRVQMGPVRVPFTF